MIDRCDGLIDFVSISISIATVKISSELSIGIRIAIITVHRLSDSGSIFVRIRLRFVVFSFTAMEAFAKANVTANPEADEWADHGVFIIV